MCKMVFGRFALVRVCGEDPAPHGLSTKSNLKKAELDRLRTLSPHALAHLEHAYDLELPFTSNAIEGNTLTQIETSLMIEQGEALRQYGSRDVSISFAGASSSAEWAIAQLGWVQHRRSRKQRLHATLAEYLTALHEALPPT